MNIYPETWYSITFVIVTVIAIPSSFYILQRETLKRRDPNVLFPSKWMSIFSYLCIAVGIIFPVIHPLLYIKRIHSIGVFVSIGYIPFLLQLLLMQYFQLSRLHYCLSRERTHSHKGYPKWLFITIFFVVTISALMLLISACYIWSGDVTYSGNMQQHVFEVTQTYSSDTVT